MTPGRSPAGLQWGRRSAPLPTAPKEDLVDEETQAEAMDEELASALGEEDEIVAFLKIDGIDGEKA